MPSDPKDLFSHLRFSLTILVRSTILLFRPELNPTLPKTPMGSGYEVPVSERGDT